MILDTVMCLGVWACLMWAFGAAFGVNWQRLFR